MAHMPGNAHPHMIFATDSEALDRTRLGEVLRSLFGDVAINEKPLAVEMDREGHHVSFWFDEDAEGLAERYADYLPETARRRRLIACRTMIDMSASDSDPQTRQDTERIASTIAELAGVWVFDETSKRFVGFDYGDAPTDEPAEPVEAAEPAAAGQQPQPAGAEERQADTADSTHEPASDEPAAPSPESDIVTQTPPPPAPEPSPPRIPRGDTAVPAPSAAAEPPPEPVPTPTGSTPYDDAPAPIPTLTGPEPQVIPPPTAEPASAYPHEPDVIAPEVAQPAPMQAPEAAPHRAPEAPAAAPAPSAAAPAPDFPPAVPAVGEEDETEKKGFFKRMFKNRRQK